MKLNSSHYPLITAIGLMVMFAIAMARGGARTDIPSPLIGKAAPSFELPALDGSEGLSTDDLKGQITLLNFWASWCGPCKIEHPYIMELSQREDIQVLGINHQDKLLAAQNFLAKSGNPYKNLGFDPSGRTGFNYGVYGIPETFIIDQDGIIRYRHAGAINSRVMKQIIIPEIEKLKR